MPKRKSLVLYCLIRKQSSAADPVYFFLMRKHGYFTFPATKFRPGEDLYAGLRRPTAEDLGLPVGENLRRMMTPILKSKGAPV